MRVIPKSIQSDKVKSYNIGLALLKIWMCFEIILDHYKNWDDLFIESLHGPFNIYKILISYGDPAVPIFMLIAFILSDMETVVQDKTKIEKRFYRLLVPTFFWAVVYYVFLGIFDIIFDRHYIHGITDLFWQLALGHSYNLSLWFQTDLILLTIIFIVLFKYFNNRIALILSALFAYFALFLQYSSMILDSLLLLAWPETMFGGFFSPSYIIYPVGRLFEMMPYAVIGIFYCHFRILARLERIRKYAIIASTSMLIFLLTYSEYFFAPRGFDYQGLYYIAVAVATVNLFYLLPFVRFSSLLNSTIVKISNHTMAIYFMHKLVGTILYDTKLWLLFKMRRGSLYDCLIIFCISFFSSCLLSKLPFKIVKVSMS